VKKKEHLITKEHRTSVKADIDALHDCRNQLEFDKLLEKTEKKWKKLKLDAFLDYFKKSWLDSEFSAWQIFHTPPGYSSSNGIIESFNRTVKTSFTVRQRLSVFNALKMIDEKIYYYSLNSKPINNTPKIIPSLTKGLNKYELKDFKKFNNEIYIYRHNKPDKIKVNIIEFHCECSFYLDKAFCLHLLSLTSFLDIQLNYYKPVRKFSVRCKRGPQGKDAKGKEKEKNKENEQVGNKASDKGNKITIAKKRGRPRKAKNSKITCFS
jgi:hypothetical protein